jgi:phage FluMu protein Com
MIAFNCPGCGKTIQGKDEFSGSKAKCPECKTLFIIPALSTSPVGQIGLKPKFFISYRREDSAGFTGRLFDRLQAHFGRESVFIDVDSIPYGVDFRTHLSNAVSKCDALLAIIADRWVSAGHEEQLRLHDPKDFVRIEIEAALSRNIPVIPVLVGRTPMPREDDLPPSMRPLIFRNACILDLGTDFHPNVDRLIHSLEQFGKKTATPVVTSAIIYKPVSTKSDSLSRGGSGKGSVPESDHESQTVWPIQATEQVKRDVTVEESKPGNKSSTKWPAEKVKRTVKTKKENPGHNTSLLSLARP